MPVPKKASKKASKEFTEKAIKDPDAAKGLLNKTMDMGNGDFYIKNTDGVDFKTNIDNPNIHPKSKEAIVGGCFLGETKVKTEDGFVAIKDIEEGNRVLTVNEETGEEEYKEVKKVFVRSGNEICIIKAGNDIIKVTTGHLFKVKDKWWTAAINIEKGDYIYTDDNKHLKVDDISVEKNNYPSFVYNLSVEENHNYFVGEEKILAHNMANMKSCTQDINEATIRGRYTDGSKVTPMYSTLDQRYEIMPGNTSSVGKWTGKPGESMFTSDDLRVKDILDEHGVKGVNYENGMPDFSPFVREEFTIDMTNDRQRNFAQANKKLAEKLSSETGEKWTSKKVSKWISDNNFTWHELNDCKTIQLVPTNINHPIFKHLGGVGEINISMRKGVK